MDPSQTPFPAFDLNAFLGSLAHDLSNPLNAISMNSELARLLSQKQQTERVGEVVERILADCSRCSRFLRDLRQFADVTKRRPRETVPAQIALDQAELMARANVTEKFPEIQLTGGDISLDVERPALETALAALLRNATEAGARNLRIDVRREADAVEIALTDDGRGLADIAPGKLGTPFFTGRRKEGSTGLGLTLCQYVAAAHGGSFSLAPVAGGGAVATLRLAQPAKAPG
jgi:two-component system OmpR family sensor kinase